MRAFAKINAFQELLVQSEIELGSETNSMENATQTLEKIRTCPGKGQCGIILISQFFAVPQIAEVIRDLATLLAFESSIELNR